MINAKKAKTLTMDACFNNTPLLPIIFNSIALACSKGKDHAFVKGKNIYRGMGSTGKTLDVVRGMGYTITPTKTFDVHGILIYWGDADADE